MAGGGRRRQLSDNTASRGGAGVSHSDGARFGGCGRSSREVVSVDHGYPVSGEKVGVHVRSGFMAATKRRLIFFVWKVGRRGEMAI